MKAYGASGGGDECGVSGSEPMWAGISFKGDRTVQWHHQVAAFIAAERLRGLDVPAVNDEFVA